MNAVFSEDAAAAPGTKDGLRRYVVRGLIVVIVAFGGLAVWSLLAPIDGAVIASGSIGVETNRKTVQHLEGGIVAKLLVKEGDHVNAGDLLVRLDDTVDRANLALINSQLDERLARRARLLAERDDAKEVAYPEMLATRVAAARVKDVLSGQINLFNARRTTRAAEVRLLEQRIRQSRNEIEGLQARQLANLRQIRFIEQELKGLRELHEKGFAPITRILALEREAERLRGERGGFIAEISKAQNAVTSSKIDIVRLESSFKAEVIAELRTVEAELTELLERRIGVEDRLKRRDIYAPRSGFVLGLRLHTVGGVVTAGEALMEIVPGDDKLVVLAQVQPQDIDKVEVGSQAVVRLTALNQRTTPEMQGKVRTVSGDRMVDQKTGIPYFVALIELSDESIKQLDGTRLTPGMPAETFIRTGERTAISYLVKPLSDSVARAFRED